MKLPVITVVLANLMSNIGELNTESKARIDLAAKLDSELQAEIILLCGWAYRHDCSLTIADAMKVYVSKQFPKLAEKAVCQKLSRDTVGDAVFSRICLDEIFIGHSSFSLNVITSDYHAKRTEEIFDFVFGADSVISVKGTPGFNRDMSATKEMESLEAFRKTFSDVSAGDLDSIYSSLINEHHFYNGAIYTRIGKMNEVSQNIKTYLASL